MPKHQFVVVDTNTVNDDSFSYYSWDSKGDLHREGLPEEDHVAFEDEFILYMNDSLNWIPSWNPSTQETGNGLNYYGVTIVEGEHNLITFRRVIQAWSDLFEPAPENIVLTGSYYTTGEDQSGQYERLEYNKTDLMKKLDKQIEIINKALTENKCILHFGI